ncbi:MAG: hypothetical protein SNH55_04380 [Rikenellaceae bacterium]
MIKTLIQPDMVLALAYSDAPYTPLQMVTASAIITAQQKYIEPIIGTKMMNVLLDDKYIELFEGYVAPAIALYVRYVVDGLGSPVRFDVLQRAREMARRMSDHLEGNAPQYPEYKANANILKRCSLNGGFVQVH